MIKELHKKTCEQMKGNVWNMVVITFVYLVITSILVLPPIFLTKFLADRHPIQMYFLDILQLIISLINIYISLGIIKLFVKFVKTREIRFRNFKLTGKEYGNMLLVTFFKFLIIFAILIAFLIIGILIFLISNITITQLQFIVVIGIAILFVFVALISLMYMLTPYIILKGYKIEAIKIMTASRRMMYGYKFKGLLLTLYLLLINIIALIPLCLGLLITIPYSTIMIINFYNQIEEKMLNGEREEEVS